MGLSVRDWLIIVGVLLILAVLIDGYRRVRNERRGNIRMALNKQFLNAENEEDDLSELPSGRARVVGRKSPQVGNEALDLERSVPMLMESVPSESPENSAAFEHVEEDLNESPDQQAYVEEYVSESLEKDNVPKAAQPAHTGSPEQQDVFVINVVAKPDGDFKGPDLLHILLACDMRFGDMNIFHRHEQANGVGAVQFSMANSVHPGIFNLDTIDHFTSPGVSFFMSVPGPEEPMVAFDYMVETAQCLVKNLGGELRDESRSVMTAQTLEHCRQRIREFERRQLTHA